MVKPRYVRNSGLFQKGHSHHPTVKTEVVYGEPGPSTTTKYMRLPFDQMEMATAGYIPENAEAGKDVRLLRPTAARKTSLEEAQDLQDSTLLDSYRLWHMEKTVNMFNECFRQHQTRSPTCRGHLKVDTTAEKKWGLVWSERLKCDKCTYVSDIYRLYKVIENSKRGPKCKK